ncbi:hypothetical protein [Bacillus cereus]|uniref:hypothetical protein n=1 Tax=Bacillus cereus TaxID=1396 RepID=UPI0020D260B4|nr:hypothetical protein [Bacillus cereus]
MKTIPFFLFLIAIIILLFVDGLDSVVRLLAFMAIGAIALPTAIWVIMSLYHKMSGKRA